MASAEVRETGNGYGVVDRLTNRPVDFRNPATGFFQTATFDSEEEATNALGVVLEERGESVEEEEGKTLEDRISALEKSGTRSQKGS